jgi:CheY-like chemotaxis protein
MPTQPKQILLAEDNFDDAAIFRLMFERAKLPHTLHHVHDGQEAIAWLDGQGKYSDRQNFPVPGLLLLDLKMPRKNGFEVLEWIRSHQQLRELPVIVLSSSDDKSDVKRAHQLGITNYFVKSPNFQDILQFLSNN